MNRDEGQTRNEKINDLPVNENINH